jgi:hypothetical protein
MTVKLGPLYPLKLALTSPTSGGRSIGIVRSRTQATEFSLVLVKLDLSSEGIALPYFLTYRLHQGQ